MLLIKKFFSIFVYQARILIKISKQYSRPPVQQSIVLRLIPDANTLIFLFFWAVYFRVSIARDLRKIWTMTSRNCLPKRNFTISKRTTSPVNTGSRAWLMLLLYASPGSCSSPSSLLKHVNKSPGPFKVPKNHVFIKLRHQMWARCENLGRFVFHLHVFGVYILDYSDVGVDYRGEKAAKNRNQAPHGYEPSSLDHHQKSRFLS